MGVKKVLHIAFNCAAVYGELSRKGSLNHLGPTVRSTNDAIPRAILSTSMNIFKYFVKRCMLGISWQVVKDNLTPSIGRSSVTLMLQSDTGIPTDTQKLNLTSVVKSIRDPTDSRPWEC